MLPLLLAAACVTDDVDPTVDTSENAATVGAIARNSTWKYWDRGGDLGTAWRGAFDDSSWASGAGALGYGESYLRTTVGYGPSATGKYITTYFRKTFTVADPAVVTALRGEVMFDDGFVVYLNGTRISADSMPTGTITASTLALGHEANNTYTSYDWSASRNLLRAGSNVVAVEVHQQAASSSDLVFDLSLALDTGAPPVELGGIERNNFWQYWDNGGDLGTAWRTYVSGQAGWDYGFGALGYGEDYLRTTVSYGPSATSKYITTYFRYPFYADNPTAVTRMVADVMYDDGFVAYLNGVEVGRAAMPAGTVAASTLSTGHEAGNAYVSFDWSAMRGALVTGQNSLAVEVHQSAASSSDLVFDLALHLYGDQPPPPSSDEDIARGSVWRFFDRGSEPSSYGAWHDPSYNDATWASGPGPLGYGETYVRTPVSYGPSASSKYITTYFRRWFTVDHPSIATRLIGELMYDDGIVVYLNGQEIARRAMPAGAVEYSTLSPGHETGNAYERYDWSAFNRLLAPGANLLAVEVHQAAATSSDLTFDLSLQVDTPAVCGIPACGDAVPPAPQIPLHGVWVGDAATWVVGQDGTIGRRDEAAGTWCWCHRDTSVTYSAVWGSADDDVWIVGGFGKVIHYDGAAFHDVDIGTTMTLTDVTGSAADDITVVGVQGTVRRFDGAAWAAFDLPADQMLTAAWAASADDLWIGGSEPAPYPGNPDYDGRSALIYRWQPATGTWALEDKRVRYYGDAGVHGIHGTGAANVWAVGLDHPAGAACEISFGDRYDGTDWAAAVPYPYNECLGLNDVVAGAPGAADGVWIVGTDGSVRYSGGVWSSTTEAAATGLVDVDYRGSRMYAVGYGVKISRWDGSRWVNGY
ncbi:MAG TPA: hypothetical protein VL172_03535 [Kofleriaceae bacterium]|nr:hypothetical protein [Kofleriaceae bacterium]